MTTTPARGPVPITIRSAEDINATWPQVEALAVRSAEVLWQELADSASGATAAQREKLIDFVAKVLRHVLLDEPSTGDGVDIAGEQFVGELLIHLAGIDAPGPLRECDDVHDAAEDALRAVSTRLARLNLQLHSQDEVRSAFVAALSAAEVEAPNA